MTTAVFIKILTQWSVETSGVTTVVIVQVKPSFLCGSVMLMSVKRENNMSIFTSDNDF